MSKPIPLWKNFFSLCNDPIVWTVCVLLGFLVVGTAYFLQQFEPMKWDWIKISIHSCCVALGFASPIIWRSCPGRIFYIFVNLSAIIFVASFSSMLMTKLTTTVLSTQIDSIKNIIDKDFSLVADQFAFEKMSQQKWVNIIKIT